ncbi:MAG: PA0069 family radical SAM protein [Pseudomonadota bacterium]
MNQQKNRGVPDRPHNRFHQNHCVFEEDWQPDGEFFDTTVTAVQPRNIISFNQSPDVPFDASINPYHGCEHGCVYCFARPTHEYLDLSSGLDFENKLFYKKGAADLLKKELSKKNYRCTPINLGVNTDCYQPMERTQKITRSLLKVLDEFNHPCALITKSTLVLRDLDILQSLASKNLVQVMISVTTLNAELKRSMEPRAASPNGRLKTIRTLSEAGLPVGVLMAPIIPGINDSEIEDIIGDCATAGVTSAGYVLIRLPHQVKQIFEQWLKSYAPLKADHIMNLVKACRGGKLYDASFGQRMSGTGEIAKLIKNRFRLACRKNGLPLERRSDQLNTTSFKVPGTGNQMDLF